MIRYASVFALVLFMSLQAFAQTPTLPGSAAGAGSAAADRMKAAAAPTVTQAKTAAATDSAKAQTAAGTAATQAKGTANSASTGAQAATAKAKGAGAQLLDLNTATIDEMKAIPSLGAVADKVIAARPFSNKSQLVSKKILDKASYDQIKSMIIAKKAK